FARFATSQLSWPLRKARASSPVKARTPNCDSSAKTPADVVAVSSPAGSPKSRTRSFSSRAPRAAKKEFLLTLTAVKKARTEGVTVSSRQISKGHPARRDVQSAQVPPSSRFRCGLRSRRRAVAVCAHPSADGGAGRRIHDPARQLAARSGADDCAGG